MIWTRPARRREPRSASLRRKSWPRWPAREKAIFGVPIEVTVSVGKARPMISEIVSLRRDSVLPLDSRIEDPVEVYVGSQLIARGELQELEDEGGRLGVRLTEIMDLGNAS